jgi:hypothetical protein
MPLTAMILKYCYGMLCLPDMTLKRIFIYMVVAACTLSLLWMDWVLGIITDNLAGVPSRQARTLYWSYFALKRLGLLST